MDLGKWLRDRKDQAARQWQNSVILDAVSANTQADKARRANQGTAETVRQRASQSYGNGFSGVMNRARDVVDANTPADRIKRQANSGLFENYQEQQNRLTNEAMNSQTDRTLPAQFGASGLREMGKFFLKAPGSIANMYGAVAQSENPIAEVARGIIPGMGVYSDADKRMGHAASQDLQRQANDLNKQIDQKINQNDYIGERQGENKWAVGLGSVAGQLPAQIATGGAGLVNTGVQMASDEYNKAREAGRSNDQSLGIGILQGGASAASEKFGVDKFLPGNGVAGNTVIKALKRFGTEGAQEGEQQFIQNLIANKTYDPNQSLKDGVLESVVLGGIAGGAMSPIADIANIGTTPKPPTQLTPEVQSKRNNLANAYTTLVDQGRPDQAAYFAREIDQIDNPQPGTLREKIRSAKDRIIPKGEDGFVQLPGKQDPLESLKQEARKYKSAEEFVRAQGSPLYRGGHTYDQSLVTDRGVSTATSKENAQWFAGGYGPDAAKSGKTIEKLYLKPDSKILNLNDVPKDVLDGFKKLNSGNTTLNEELALVNYARKQGYDAIDLAPWGEAEVRVINKDAIRTKQQLTDLYNQSKPSLKDKLGIKPLGEDGYVKNPFYKEPKTQTLRDYYDRSVGMKKGDKQFTITEAKTLLRDLTQQKAGVPQEITQGGYKDLTPQQIQYALNNPATSQGKAIRTFLDQKIDRGNELYKHLDNLQEKLDGLEENPGPNYKKDVDELIDQINNIKDINKDPHVIEFKKFVQDNKELLDSGDLRAINEAADLRDNAENSRFNIDEENVVDLPESRFLDEIGENTRTYGLDELAKDTQTIAPNQADLLSYKPKTTDKVEQLRQQNAIPNENLQRIDALNNTMVAASEVKQKLKQPNDLQEKGVNETVARNRLRNKLMAEKMDVEAPQVGKTADTSSKLVEYMNQELFKKQGTPDMAFKRVAKRFDGKDNYLLGGQQSVTAEQLKDATYKAKVADFNKQPQYATEQFISTYVSQNGLNEADFRKYLSEAKTVAPVESKTETPLAKSERLHQEKLTKNNLTQNEYAGLHDKVKELDSKASELHRKVSDATQKAVEQANGQPLTPKVRRQLKAMADEWGKALDDHVDALNVVRKIDGEKPIATSRTKKPFTPLSQPVDNIPAIVKQVTGKKQQVDGKLPKVAKTVVETRAATDTTRRLNTQDLANKDLKTANKKLQDAGMYYPNDSGERKAWLELQKNNNNQNEATQLLTNYDNAKKAKQLTTETLTPKQYADTFGVSEEQASQDLSEPAFDAAATSKKNSTELIKALKTDKKVTRAAKTTQQNGKELNFYAKKDANGRSVGIETFNPKTHRIEAGFVVDERGNVLGNHIKVDETGVQVNVGGDLINMDSIIGNPLEWGSTSKRTGEKKGKYKLSETMSRNIDNNAPTPEIANTTKRFLWSSKVKAEANMRTELDAEFTALDDRIKRTNKARPSNVSKEQYKDDIFATLNGDKTDAEIEAEYKPNAAQAILTYKKETRTLYDSLLKRINAERVKFGQEPITPRKDYITHLQEMNQNKGFVTEVYGQMKNSFADEGMGKTRNGVPGDIAGRTENFKPISKYNPFLQRREGTKSLRDPFMAVQEYLQPALYNIHMTEPGARARAVETAFRTAEQLKQMDTRSVATEMESTLKKYQNTSSDNSKLITGFQEYANAVAGKTQRFDRQVTDSSDAAAKSLKVWQGLQRIGGRGTILGNISSILAQPLNQVVGIADAGGINYAKGIAEYMGGDSQIDKSDFIRARETEATKPLRGTGEKILDAGSVPLQAVELASVKLMWHTQHQKALSEGYTGQEAVQQADMNTERLVAGRGIADKPELYRSTVANGVYQYTLEVNAQNKAFWQDLDTKQKVKFMVAASATNALMGAITGFEPLPDFLKAIFETGKDIIDPEDDRSVARKLGGGVQRMGDEYAGMNPLISGIANILPQDTRKAVFGQDSQLGRFAGGSAPIQVVKNTTNAASKVAKGDFKGAGYDAIRNVPFGNQIRKTVSGAELIAKGYSTDKNGKKTFDAPTSIAGKAQVLAFGPSASKNAQGYYNGTGDKITTTDANGNTRVTKTTQSGITVNKTKNYEDAVSGIKSSYGGKYAELTEEEVKELGKTDADAKDYYKTLQAVKQSSKTPDELPTNLNPLATSIYEKEARLTTDGKDKWNKRPSANKEVNNTIRSWLPKGVDAPRITNATTKQWADYEKKKAEGTLGKLEEESAKRTILRSAYNSVLTEDEKDLYTLSEDKLLDAYNRGVINDQNIDKALKVERQLFDAGLISTETLAKKLGLVARGYKGRSGGRGGRGGSGKTAKDTSVAFSNALQSTTLKRLNSLLAGTQSGGSTSRRVATSKPVLKKISVRA